MKTVTHNGKEYQIGALYEFSDSGTNWSQGFLECIQDDKTYQFLKKGGVPWKRIREIQNPVIGTIKDAHVVLSAENAYEFDHPTVGSAVGYYHYEKECFDCAGVYFKVGECTRIVKLVPEVK